MGILIDEKLFYTSFPRAQVNCSFHFCDRKKTDSLLLLGYGWKYTRVFDLITLLVTLPLT